MDSDQPPLYLIIIPFIVFIFSALIESVFNKKYRYVFSANLSRPYWTRFRRPVLFAINLIKIISFFAFFLFLTYLIDLNNIYRLILLFISTGMVFILLNLILHKLGTLPVNNRLFKVIISPYFTLSFIFYPLYLIHRFMERIFKVKKDATETPHLNEEEVNHLLENDVEKELEEMEMEMIKGIVDFRDRTTVEIMVPRVDLIASDVDTSIYELKELIKKKGHSRIPIYEDTIDNIIGIIHAKELIDINDTEEVYLRNLLSDAYFVPETKKLNQLLLDFQREKNQVAIVVDEYGGVSGIVTIEDILEEIVGEIQDEYDDEEEMIKRFSEGLYLINPKIDIGELNEELGVNLPDEDYETLGGFIYDRLERVPRQGDKVIENDVELTVNKADERRILRVMLSIEGKEKSR